MDAIDLSDVDPARRAEVAFDAIVTARRKWHREHRRPTALTAREALAALQFNVMLFWTAMGNHLNGVELTREDFDQLTAAMRAINLICDEVGI